MPQANESGFSYCISQYRASAGTAVFQPVAAIRQGAGGQEDSARESLMDEEITMTRVSREMPGGHALTRFQPRLVKYGLPCACCRAYYCSGLLSCPVFA